MFIKYKTQSHLLDLIHQASLQLVQGRRTKVGSLEPFTSRVKTVLAQNWHALAYNNFTQNTTHPS